jgi:hypothetical protein
MKFLAAAFLFVSLAAARAQTTPSTDPFQPLAFLTGTWNASGQGPSGAAASGTYTFQLELANHVLARHSTSAAGCKGPATFDCEHGDLLYIYADAPGQPLRAIYFDNEGHVIHYTVSTPEPATAIFLSDATQPGPQFRLVYQLKATERVMSGKFQARMPGQSDWTSYLEWSGTKR